MNLDLSNPAHVEALREAAVMARDEPQKAAAMASAARGILNAGTKTLIVPFVAALILSDPTSAADLLRRLLERCGVTVVEHGTSPGEPRWPCVLIYDLAAEPLCVVVSPRRMPHIAMDLLDAHDHAAALAALRGER